MCVLYYCSILHLAHLTFEQHGGEGRLSEKFSEAMHHVSNEDAR